MTNSIPTFGAKSDDADYKTRTGVHAIIQNGNGEICILQTPNGAFYLPGGEIEAGETHAQTFARELMEEIGASATMGDYLGEAADYYYSRHRDEHFYNPIHIYIAENVQLDHKPTESGNNICWFIPYEAKANLKRDSHKWAIDQWLEYEAKKSL